MKTLFYIAAGAVLLAGAAHAQTMTTTEVQTDVIPSTVAQGAGESVTTYSTTVEQVTVGAEPAVDPGRMATVKLEDGKTVQFPDTMEKSWQEYAREQGYDRFIFAPESGLFVVGKGEKKFEGKWDENGNRIPTPAAKQVKKVEPVDAATPAAEQPETQPADTASQPATEAAAPVAVPESAEPASTAPTMDTPTDSVNPSEKAPAEVMPSVEGGAMPEGEEGAQH